MKTIIRNFINVLVRFKVATFLNVAGLAVAFAAFLIIMMQVSFERNFDRCHPNSARIYRMGLAFPDGTSLIHSRPLIESFIHSSPHIEAGTLVNPYVGEMYVTVTGKDGKQGFKEMIVTCHPEITRMFQFTMREGESSCLSDPEKALLPESMARRLFGEESAIGKQIVPDGEIWTKPGVKYLVVGGVYEDFPENTQLRNVIYTEMSPDYALTNWTNNNYFCYVMLDPSASPEEVAENFDAHFDYSKLYDDVTRGVHAVLVPLTDIYYMNEDSSGSLVRSGSAEKTRLLTLIALLVIIVAGINFTNFSTSLAPLRIKSINTQKVLGSSVGILRASLLFEAVGISLLAFLCSLFIVWGLGHMEWLYFVQADTALTAYPGLVGGLAALSVVIGFIAGIYPSWYMTSFPPAVVLKGSFGLSSSGKKLRTALIGFQFVVSIVLIISAMFVRQQNRFMQRYSLGFDKDQVVVVELNRNILLDHKDSYVSGLKEYPGIEDVAFCSEKFGSEDGYRTWAGMYKEQNVGFTSLSVSWNFFKVMGIPLIGGRMPTESDEKGKSYSYIFNKQMRDKWNMEPNGIMRIPWLGEESAVGSVIGFVDDVKFTSLRRSVSELGFVINEPRLLFYSFIRVKAGSDIMGVVDHIRKTVALLDPTYPCEVEFYDGIFDHLYHQERNLSTMILLFSLLAVIISIVGIFGLVIFETQYRRKEIGLRKVFGATVNEILVMFNKIYFRIVCVCFVIAAPLAYYGVRKWLEGFAYKTPIYWWIFAVALLIVSLITMITVTFQNWRAANANPVDSIKTE
ncbi:ABC transporter permease [uncultured Parabacteroides sp.]|uniref:ABC transporter permease n=1 Tax=uncultured Parabacteroides sp. TaxID=512312 RepID=UPI002620D16A|nr:ABC transporter permease [uncultured Parabacteroides sp.]